MKYVLISWIGLIDLRAPIESEKIGLGPVAQAIEDRVFDEAVLISDHAKDITHKFIAWLSSKSRTSIKLYFKKLSSPTHLGEIYQADVNIIEGTLARHKEGINLVFHLSPGSPAMAAAWILLGKTRYPAELIESSREHGIKTASIPFDISADFIPDLLRKPDEQLERLSAGLPPEAPEFSDIIHRSLVMERVIAKARRVAVRSVPVLIEGESGTGKELFARAIHMAGPRRNKPLLSVSCGAIPSELVESHLFGHEKGSFTGANRQHKGFFETANGGTLFLDEVGELPLLTQVKLLRVLQEDEILRVGANQTIKVDVRLIAATNRPLTEDISNGRFRADLFYRLAVAVLKLPPLRDRQGDVSLLIGELLKKINQESECDPGYEYKKFSASAKNILLGHSWPGNVRELLNTLRRAAIWTTSSTINAEDVRDALLPLTSSRQVEILNKPIESGVNLPEMLAMVARHYLSRALDETRGNKVQAAKLLGLPNYQTFTNWHKKYLKD